jgi:Zn-finger nucleic acid-binding protein
MKCPACGGEMVRENFGINVDVCERGCKGLWFDRGELRMLDEHDEGLGAALEAALRAPRRNDEKRGPLTCPACGIPMHTHAYARDRAVNVDECYKCGGFFLDSGELKEIRDHYMADADVKAYADQIIASVPEYASAMKDLGAEQQRVESVQKFTKFLTVNYWRKRFV